MSADDIHWSLAIPTSVRTQFNLIYSLCAENPSVKASFRKRQPFACFAQRRDSYAFTQQIDLH